jgi:type IV secretory pathway TraG/TraD family ATPase VirD4
MPLMRLILNQIARALMEKQTQDAQGREKKHSLLLVLDEFPQLGRMPFFETAMGAMAGYGLKSYLVCQSLNHITRAYGRDNVILENYRVQGRRYMIDRVFDAAELRFGTRAPIVVRIERRHSGPGARS